MVTALFALGVTGNVEAAHPLVPTEMISAISDDVGRTDGDERRPLAEDSPGATSKAPGDDSREVRVPELRAVPASKSDHMFGVLPNYATVEAGDVAARITTRQTFQMAALGSFDPYVFPFVGVVTAVNPGLGQSFAHRYATALADNAIGNFLTSAVMPMAMNQDPRYFESGTGSVSRRIGYAASRSLLTRSRSGRTQFNVSEIGGNAIAAAVSNVYHSAPERSVGGTLTRWGMQVLWDTLSNEMKEFWPDIRARLHRHADVP